MSPARQASLFDTDEADNAEAAPARHTTLTLATGIAVKPNGAQPLSRWQREFNTLTASLTQLREGLAHATALLDDYRSHVAKVFDPRWREMMAAQREWILAADQVLQRQATTSKAQRLSRKQQKHLAAFVVDQIDDLLGQTGDDDEALVVIHDRYSDISLDETREVEQAMVKAMMEDVVGSKAMQGHEDSDLETLLRHAREQLEAQQQARAAKAAARPGKAALQREQAAKAVSQSLREVYRKLASTLHPDREPDAQARERKTRLMQAANQAYEKGDLLTLLSMQIDVLQADQVALNRADDARLKLYCQALREQQLVLRREIAESEAPIRQALQLGPLAFIPTRAKVLARVDLDTKNLKRNIAGLRGDIQALLDPRQSSAVIDTLVLPEDEAVFEGLDAMDLQAMFSSQPRRRRR